MRLKLVERGDESIMGERRPWSLVTRLAAYYTVCATALLLVAMLFLYEFVVQHINADDDLFLADTLRAVKADLADKRTVDDHLLADEVPPGTNDYFVRVLDAATKQLIAENLPRGRSVIVFVLPCAVARRQGPNGGQRL